MANRISVSALNLSASPHPEGVYRNLLRYAAGYEVALGGSDYAQITNPTYRSAEDHNVIHGRIGVWTPISKEADWYDRTTKDKATAEQKRLISIPDNIEPNYRYFYYAFDIKRHLLIFENRNSEGQTFSVSRCEKLFDILFDDLPEDAGADSVAVSAIPETGTVETILSLPKLRHLKIVVTRPNAEDLSEEYQAIMDKMTNEKTRAYSVELHHAEALERFLIANLEPQGA